MHEMDRRCDRVNRPLAFRLHTKTAGVGSVCIFCPHHPHGGVRGRFGALRASCERHRVPLDVLGLGQPWRGFAWRIQLMRDYLDHQPPERLVVFVDAYDVVVVQDREEILRRYRALAPGGRILFSVDNPVHYPLTRAFHRLFYGPACRRSRHVNGGGYMGPAGALAGLMARVYDEDPTLRGRPRGLWWRDPRAAGPRTTSAC